MRRLWFKLLGSLVFAGLVYWRMSGAPLPEFMAGSALDDRFSAPLPIGSDVAGARVDSPVDAMAIVLQQVTSALEQTQEAGERARQQGLRTDIPALDCALDAGRDAERCAQSSVNPGQVQPAPVQQPVAVSRGGSGNDAADVRVFRPNY